MPISRGNSSARLLSRNSVKLKILVPHQDILLHSEHYQKPTAFNAERGHLMWNAAIPTHHSPHNLFDMLPKA